MRIMAAINVSPESFYGDSVKDTGSIRAAAARCVRDGADFIDLGAMSTAPYLDTAISEQEESDRMVAAVRAVAAEVDVPISADTTRTEVAAAALDAGARLVNDVRGLRSPGMGVVAARSDGVVLMASPPADVEVLDAGTPVQEVTKDLRSALARAQAAGVDRTKIVLDPGIGFYRNSSVPPTEFACASLRHLSQFLVLGLPILVGVSRKSFIGDLSGRKSPADRLAGSLAAAAVAVWNGASVIRTHDVAATVDAVRVTAGVMGHSGLRTADRDE